jgi:hypothetical protein
MKSDLSKLVSSDVSNTKLTLAVIDESCSSAYNSWLALNKNRIKSSITKGKVRIHLMKRSGHDLSFEYVVIISTRHLYLFNIDVSNFKSKESKLLIFGSESKKVTSSLVDLFERSIDVTHECK